MTKPNLFLVFAIAAILLAFFGVKQCNRQEEAAKAPAAKPETIRKRVATTNATESAKYQKEAQYWKARFKADSAARTEAARKDKQATEKARHSAANYAKSGKHEDCSTALTDCQEENETKAFSLAVQERMLRGFESSDSLHRWEIDRRGSVIDTLNKGWEEANRKLAKEKGKRFGLGLHLGYGATKTGFSPVVSVGLNWNIAKF